MAALKQQLQQKLQQKLSPQQIQLIRLLELTEIEFEERVQQELVDNPALEEGREEIPDSINEFDANADEIVHIFKPAFTDERKRIFNIVSEVNPANSSKYNALIQEKTN